MTGTGPFAPARDLAAPAPAGDARRPRFIDLTRTIIAYSTLYGILGVLWLTGMVWASVAWSDHEGIRMEMFQQALDWFGGTVLLGIVMLFVSIIHLHWLLDRRLSALGILEPPLSTLWLRVPSLMPIISLRRIWHASGNPPSRLPPSYYIFAWVMVIGVVLMVIAFGMEVSKRGLRGSKVVTEPPPTIEELFLQMAGASAAAVFVLIAAASILCFARSASRRQELLRE